MERPHFLHQQHHHHHHQPTNRYAPLPPPPNPNPPPPPSSSLPPHPRPNFPSSTTTSFHSPHHHNHQFPQPQNPQLPSSYQFHHPPPPPLQQQPRQHFFNPTQSQSQSQSQSRFAFSPRPLVDRIPLENDRPRHPDNRPDFWNPSRVLPDTRPARTVSPPPYRPIDKYRHDSEGMSGMSRFRVENKYNDGFDLIQRKDLVWGRGDDNNYHRRDYFVSNSDATSSREFGFGSNLRDIESNSAGTYNHRYGSVRDNEVCRSGRIDASHDRIASRDLRDSLSFDMKSNEIGDGDDDDDDGVRIGSGKREYYASELGRFSNRGSKEGSHDSNRTPRKQIQKKSALLRIQMVKPNHRNRDSDQFHYFGYYDKNNSGSFRSKDQFVYSGHGVEKEEELGQEEEKEGSPVELDVSFKSNSLVAKAKAIVAPSTSANVSYTDMNPRDRKNRKVFDGGSSNSRLIKLTEGTVNLDSSTCVANEASGSDKDLKQSEEKVMTSGIGNVCDGSSPSSNATNMSSQRKSIVERSPKGMVPNKDDTNVGSGKSSLKVVKKKKVVKKVVKKVINPNSHLLSSQQTNKCDEPVKAESSTHGPPSAFGSGKGITPSKQIIASDDMSSMHNAVLQPCTDEVDVLSSMPRVPMIERFENSPTSPLVSSSQKECKIDEGPVYGNKSVCSSHRSLTSDNDLTKPLIEIKFSDIGSVEGVSKQFCHNGPSLSLENGAEKESSEAIFSLQGKINSDLLSSEEIKIHKDITSLYTSAHGAVTSLGFENYTIKSQENVTICDVGIMDAIRKQPCTNQVTTSPENSTFSVGSSAIVGSLSSEETNVHQGLIYAESSNHGRDAKKPSPGGVTISLENCAIKKSIKKSPNTIVSVRASEGNMQKNKKRKKVRTQLDVSSSRISDTYIEPVNDIVRPAHAVDTPSSLSVNDPSPAEVAVPGVGSLDVVSHPSNDSVNVLHGNSSAEGFSEVKFTVRSDVDGEPDGASPRYKSKREVSGSHSALSSPTVFETNEGPAGTSTSCAEVPLTNDDDLKQAKEEVAVSSINTLCTTGLMPSPNGISSLLENSLGGGSFDAVASIRNADDGLKLQHQGVDFCSNPKDSTIRNEESPCPSGLGSEPKENTLLVMALNINQNNTMDIETSGERKMDVQSADNRVLTCSGTAQSRISSDLQPPDLDQRFTGTNMGSDYLLVKDDLPSVSNYTSLSIDGAGVSASNSNDEVESLSGTLLDIGSPESLSKVPGISMLSCKASVGQIANEKVCGDDKSVVEGGPNVSAHTSFPQYTKADLATESDHSIMGKTEPLLSQDFKNTTRSPNLMSADLMRRKTQPGHAIPRTFPGRSSFASTTSKKIVSSTSIAKPRTWHRTGNSSAPLPGNKPFSSSVPPQRQLTGNNVKPQSTSYIRKGNSLVRQPAPVAALHQGSHGLSSSVYQANSSCNNESKKSTGSDSRVDATNPQNLLRTGGKNVSFERPRTPPLPNGTKLSTRTAVSSGDYTSSPLAEHSFNGCSETTSDPMKHTETNNVPKLSAEDALSISETPENQTGPSNNLETLTELNDGNVASLNMKRIVYVKRKSNQLVATSNPCDLSVQNGDKIQAASDGYYKRRKNQLIRASLENHIKQTVAMPDDILNSERQQIPKFVSSRKFSKGRLHRVVGKTFKPKKSSLVWTLCGTQSSKNNVDSLHHQKVLPHLFPWKRATYWRSFMQNPASISNNSSVSMISRKLLLLRKRDTVYTRSSHGFSLRKSRVLSVGGSSLKWSKSIEKHSKKANEEATLAVAAVEKKKREQNSAACSSSGPKNRNHSPRERIFRIGSVRYKMDSSKRTLQRISDDESTCSTALQSEKDAKKSYIPRRLVIGNDEYVRIGNGNQLIRDPKKRTRILASEKVRWSLHTARQRLARKRKYCQFFTRFGKCTKDDGKCPYIHDPSKIAVCTKFLNGLCFNPNCKLTHKVIPERMPDCSYFLQGLCNNRSCPYRHVNVNPKASSCEGFLRGYCADGNECRKKHTYVCPIFEATGTCPQGSKCKLHHPKSRSKGKKRKRSGEKKNGLGRYFRSMHVNVSEPGTAVYEKHSKQTNDDIFLEGKIVDYVSLDVSDEEVGERNDATCQQTFCDSDLSDVELDDIDELIKPIRIMNKNLMT